MKEENLDTKQEENLIVKQIILNMLSKTYTRDPGPALRSPGVEEKKSDLHRKKRSSHFTPLPLLTT